MIHFDVSTSSGPEIAIRCAVLQYPMAVSPSSVRVLDASAVKRFLHTDLTPNKRDYRFHLAFLPRALLSAISAGPLGTRRMELSQTTRSSHRLALRETGMFDRPSDGVATWEKRESDSGGKKNTPVLVTVAGPLKLLLV